MATTGNFSNTKLNEGSVAKYRFLITDPCQGFRFQVNEEYGEYVVFLKHGQPATPSSYDLLKISRGANVEYFSCPEAEEFKLGTWFAEVRGNV